ncbi:MAG TPA: hypothetical protein VHB47_22725 [Thermoanaerobaculia bacterium]|nr:hypothetical protein [Thermoanaerobaculia bacterium]
MQGSSHDPRARFVTVTVTVPVPAAPPRNVIVAACWLLAAAAALLPPALPAAPKPPSTPAAPTLAEVLARSLAARGGNQKVHAVTTRRETGMLALGAGNEWPFTVEHKRPRSFRMELELQGASLVRTFDGAHGWQKQPQGAAPEPLAGDDLHNIFNEADFDNALVDTSTKGKAELVGKETMGGHDAYKVRVTLLSGDVFDYGVDAVSYLPIHWEGSRLINGKPVVFESDFTDYRDAGGVKYPFQIESSIKGSAQKQKITFSKIEVNVPIDDARFTPASIAAPPAATPAAAPPPTTPKPAPPPAPPPPG